MAKQLGNNGVVTIGTSVVAQTVDFSWDEGVNIVDTTVLGDTSDTHLAGTTNASGSLNCMWDATDTNGQEAMTIGASLSITFLPEGNTTGKIKYSGTATIATIGYSSANNTTITRAFGVTVNGAITQGTVA